MTVMSVVSVLRLRLRVREAAVASRVVQDLQSPFVVRVEDEAVQNVLEGREPSVVEAVCEGHEAESLLEAPDVEEL